MSTGLVRAVAACVQVGRPAMVPGLVRLGRRLASARVDVHRHERPSGHESGATGSTGRPTMEAIEKHRTEDLEKVIAPLGQVLGRSLKPGQVLADLDQAELAHVLRAAGCDPKIDRALLTHADTVTSRFFGNSVFFRGIVEFSNVCVKDCLYCGIRKHMPPGTVERYTMTKEEIMQCVQYAYERQYGSLLLQSGELPTPRRDDFVCEMTRAIRETTAEAQVRAEEGRGLREGDLSPEKERGLGVVLCVGERTREAYARYLDAGAHRYLLRLEASDPDLYRQLHPESHSYDTRLRCLQDLQDLGFQVGTGFMVGVPGQTEDHIARDLLFLREFGADMIGAGPYVFHKDTPVGRAWLDSFGGGASLSDADLAAEKERQLRLSLRFYALARATLGNVNMAATTALQALDPTGREKALRAGCNVLMPVLTPRRLREGYRLYEGKPCVDEDASQCRACVLRRVRFAGREPVMDGAWHDPPAYAWRRAGGRAWEGGAEEEGEGAREEEGGAGHGGQRRVLARAAGSLR